MLISGALTRCFTRTGFACLLAASVCADDYWQNEGVAGREKIRRVALHRIDLPMLLPAGLEPSQVDADSILRVRTCNTVSRLFPAAAAFHFVFSPTARYLAAVVEGGQVFVWDLLAGRALPPLEMAGLLDCVFVPALLAGRAALRLLLASSAGLGIATFIEGGSAERIHGVAGQWDLEFKPSEAPPGRLLVHTFSRQVAVLTREQDLLSLWDLTTLCGPQVRTLDGREGSETGPRCIHLISLRNPLVACRFTPDGRQVVLLRADGQLTLHGTDRPGMQEELAALANPHLVDAPLALAADGCRIAASGPHGLLLWERADLRDPFGLPRATNPPELAPGAGDVLEFTHQGDPIVLSGVGVVHWYDWEQASRRLQVPLRISDAAHGYGAR
ncbi:MAG TPA: hypothetical protein VGF67_11155 [Ktedonobacteraceae bacterium]|jgi:hypothetical protein